MLTFKYFTLVSDLQLLQQIKTQLISVSVCVTSCFLKQHTHFRHCISSAFISSFAA